MGLIYLVREGKAGSKSWFRPSATTPAHIFIGILANFECVNSKGPS